jgi:predicted DNA-binding transcriptional regulator YafY
LSISYYNRAGEQKEDKEVMPLGLVQQGPNLYLVCRFHGYDNERNLALHRIRSARKTALNFDRPKDFDLQKYDDEGRFGYGDGKKIRLTFHILKNAGIHLLETRLSADQMVKELEDSYEIGATVVDSKILEWWLRGFGEDVWGGRKDTL